MYFFYFYCIGRSISVDFGDLVITYDLALG